MNRFAPIIAAALVMAACAAEDPPAALAPESVDTTTAQIDVPTTTQTQAPAEADLDNEQEEDHSAETSHDASDEHSNDAMHEPSDEDASVEARVIEVTMSEFAFEPSVIEVAAGETVTFIIENVGVVEHEFRLSNAHRIDEHIASGHADHHDGQEGHHDEDGDVIGLVAAGDTAQLTFRFPEDATLYTHVACLIPGHYEAGMVAELTTG